MIRLSEEVARIDSSSEVADIIERRWHRDVSPVLEEIRREVAAARYPRRLLDAVTSDPTAMASSAGALTLAAGGLAFSLSAFVPAVAAAALPLLKARADRNQRLDQARTNRLFFLYAVPVFGRLNSADGTPAKDRLSRTFSAQAAVYRAGANLSPPNWANAARCAAVPDRSVRQG